MLDSMRKRKENFFYSFVILAVVAVMMFFGMGKMGGDDAKQGVAAWVNGEGISNQEFRQVLEYKMMQYQSMLGNQYDEKLLSALQIPQRTLEELVQYKLLAQQAKKLGFVVPDFELADSIRSIPMYQKDGKFDAEAYSKLPNRGVEERRRREQLQTAKFQNYLADRIRFTPEEIRKAYLLKETKAEVEIAKIDFASLVPKFSITPKDTEAFLKTVPQEELKSYYDAHKETFTEKGSVNLRQIRVAIPFKANDVVKAEAKKKMESIQKEVNASNFEQLARTRSDDEHAKKGGNAGWITRGNLEKALEDAIDKLQPGQISPPIETAFGHYLLQVLDKKPSLEKPLDSVKTQVAEALLMEKKKKDFIAEKKTQWEELLKAGKPLDAELKKAKVELKKTGSFSLGQGFIPNVGQMDAMVDALFTLTKEKPVANRLFFFQDHYYYMKLVSVELPKKDDFMKASEAVEKGMATALQGEVFSAWIKELEKKSTIKTEVGKERGSREG